MQCQRLWANLGCLPAIGNSDCTMAAKEIVTAALARENVIVFSKEFCPFCTRVKDLLTSRGVAYKAIELDSDEPIVYAGASV